MSSTLSKNGLTPSFPVISEMARYGMDIAHFSSRGPPRSGSIKEDKRKMKKKVLLVDDMMTVIMTEKMMLASEGYELETASDGLQALDRVKAEPPDLVLLDMMMPNLDGIETCKRIKGNPDTRHIPVIIITTRGEDDRKKRGYEAGCDDYITKPFGKTELVSKVRALLSETGTSK